MSKYDMGLAAISAGKSVKQQLVSNGYPDCTVGLCPMIGKNDTENETFTLNNANEVLKFAQTTDYICLLAFWSMNRDVQQSNDGEGPLYAKSAVKQNVFDFTNIFKGITSTPSNPVPVPSSNTNLVGKVVLGNVVQQDGKNEWLKINGVVTGDTFGYQSYKSKDIGNLLDTVIKDSNVAVLIYNWKTGDAYSKTGFAFDNSSDTKVNSDFTSFIVKAKVNNSQVPNVQTPVPSTSSNNFVKWDGNNFVSSGNKMYIAGINVYWLGFTEQYDYPTHDQIEEMFIVAKNMSCTVIRSHTLGFSNGSPKTLTPSSPTGFNNDAWEPIDYAFSMAKKYGIKLIIPMCDPYEYFHGNYGFYTNIRGVDKTQFWTDGNVRNDFKSYLNGYFNHINKYTGVAIKESPELCMIELGNELGNIRNGSGSTSIPTKDWLQDISSYIKSIDSNHLILNGSDECLGQNDDFNINTIDCHSGHFYGIDTNRIDYGANNSKNKGKGYIIGEYSSQFGGDWFSTIESRPNVKGDIFWCGYPHSGGYKTGDKVEHNDGYTLHYPEDSEQLLMLTNHFRRMQGLQEINTLPN